MAVDTKHPLFVEFEIDWMQMRDTYRGERVVKAAGVKYLPPTSGMEADGMKNAQSEGYKAWRAYLKRAVFPDFVSEAVEAALGVMHHKPAVIELPPELEPMREQATVKGESLQMLLRRINEEQLVTGRLGLLAEVPTGPGEQKPYIAFYQAEHVINWDEGSRTELTLENLNLVVLDETGFERTNRSARDFDWELVRKYRVLVLGDVEQNEPMGKATYRVGVFKEKSTTGTEQREGETTGTDFNEANLIEPVIGGKKALELPFVFINSKDIVSEPDDPPLLGISNVALTVYRGEADYRQALFMQGQDTLVTIGYIAETPGIKHRIGAGASIDVPMGGDAKFIGTDSAGLEEMRMSIENDTSRASRKAGEILDDTSRAKESGEALKVRVAARTATLNQLSLAGAFGLQELLRKIARWMGANPEAVKVTPNLDFTDEVMTGEELAKLQGAKTLGAPISSKTIHKNMEDRGMTDLTYEEELEQLEEEADNVQLNPPPPSTDPDGPEDDEEGEGDDEGEGKPGKKPPMKPPAKADKKEPASK